MKKPGIFLFVILILAGAGYTLSHRVQPGVPTADQVLQRNFDDLELIKDPRTAADKIVNGAKQQVIDMVVYDAGYVRMEYPNGDVPADRGACTDVIVRALRNAGYDLQRLMHEDMKVNFRLYPGNRGLTRPDPNIDHRRVPNHLVFMKRFAKELPKGTSGKAVKTWQHGDLVYWDFGSGLTHCGVVSDKIGPRGLPLIIHNNGPRASQDDALDCWPVLGHFRYPKG